MKTSEVLGKTKDYIDEHGWCQSTFQSLDGKVCMAGAIAMVTDVGLERHGSTVTLFDVRSEAYSDLYSGATRAIERYLEQNSDEQSSNFGVPYYNDYPTTTKQDVLDLLDKVRIQAEERGE